MDDAILAAIASICFTPFSLRERKSESERAVLRALRKDAEILRQRQDGLKNIIEAKRIVEAAESEHRESICALKFYESGGGGLLRDVPEEIHRLNMEKYEKLKEELGERKIVRIRIRDSPDRKGTSVLLPVEYGSREGLAGVYHNFISDAARACAGEKAVESREFKGFAELRLLGTWHNRLANAIQNAKCPEEISQANLDVGVYPESGKDAERWQVTVRKEAVPRYSRSGGTEETRESMKKYIAEGRGWGEFRKDFGIPEKGSYRANLSRMWSGLHLRKAAKRFS